MLIHLTSMLLSTHCGNKTLQKKNIRKNVQFWDFLAPKIETYFVLSFFRSLEKTKSKICRSVQRHDPDGRRW